MARAKKNGEFINCKIEQSIVDKLNLYSEQSMIPKTAIVEMAVKEYLDKVSLSNKKKKR